MKKCISILLSFLLFTSILALTFLWSASEFVTRKNLEKEFAKIDVSKIDIASQSTGNTAIEKTISAMQETLVKNNVPKDIANQIMSSDMAKNFLVQMTSNVTNYVINGKDGKILTNDQFDMILNQNINKMIADNDKAISDTQRDRIILLAKQKSAPIIDTLPTTKETVKKIDENTLRSIQFLFGSTLRMILMGTGIFSITLLIWIQFKKAKALLYIGVSGLLSGVSVLALSTVLPVLMNILINDEFNYIINLIQDFMDSFLKKTMVIGIVTMVISLVFLIIYGYKHKKSVKQNVEIA